MPPALPMPCIVDEQTVIWTHRLTSDRLNECRLSQPCADERDFPAPMNERNAAVEKLVHAVSVEVARPPYVRRNRVGSDYDVKPLCIFTPRNEREPKRHKDERQGRVDLSDRTRKDCIQLQSVATQITTGALRADIEWVRISRRTWSDNGSLNTTVELSEGGICLAIPALAISQVVDD